MPHLAPRKASFAFPSIQYIPGSLKESSDALSTKGLLCCENYFTGQSLPPEDTQIQATEGTLAPAA